MEKSKYGEVEISGKSIIGFLIFLCFIVIFVIVIFENPKDYKTKIDIVYQDNSKETLYYDKSVMVNLKEGDLIIDNCTERSSVKYYDEIQTKK